MSRIFALGLVVAWLALANISNAILLPTRFVEQARSIWNPDYLFDESSVLRVEGYANASFRAWAMRDGQPYLDEYVWFEVDYLEEQQSGTGATYNIDLRPYTPFVNFSKSPFGDDNMRNDLTWTWVLPQGIIEFTCSQFRKPFILSKTSQPRTQIRYYGDNNENATIVFTDTQTMNVSAGGIKLTWNIYDWNSTAFAPPYRFRLWSWIGTRFIITESIEDLNTIFSTTLEDYTDTKVEVGRISSKGLNVTIINPSWGITDVYSAGSEIFDGTFHAVLDHLEGLALPQNSNFDLSARGVPQDFVARYHIRSGYTRSTVYYDPDIIISFNSVFTADDPASAPDQVNAAVIAGPVAVAVVVVGAAGVGGTWYYRRKRNSQRAVSNLASRHAELVNAEHGEKQAAPESDNQNENSKESETWSSGTKNNIQLRNSVYGAKPDITS